MQKTSIMLTASLILGLGSVAQASGQRLLPRPLPNHPGNVFLADEDIELALPREAGLAWRVIDYDSKVVAEGQGVGRIQLGRLPVGYYEILSEQNARVTTVCVLSPLSVPTPKTSPIACDVGTAWFYPESRLPAVASLCNLAGLNWVRDRYSWPELEPERGKFRTGTRYDATARVQSEAGLRVLQVNHHTPPWAGARENRFPADLRDVHGFYREMARRWKGQVQAFEPWNEADWVQFGGHLGSEIASFQKASYLGLKAGNPDVIVCQSVFANYFPSIIEDFAANQVGPYFDTLNFHHYWSLAGLPKYYEQFRMISAGRPIWVTECNFVRALSAEGIEADPKLQDFSPDGLRRQAAHVHQLLAISIHNGSTATFWFILPDYREGPTQFGLLRTDLTPRPAYMALAAAGRLLADAQPIGRLKSYKDFNGYLFRARPDGKDQIVLIAWTDKDKVELALKAPASATFDTIGRVAKQEGCALAVTASPIIALFPAGSESEFDLEPSPKLPPFAEDKPSPVVLQALWPSYGDWLQSNYHIRSDVVENMPIYVYNFGQTEVQGRLMVKRPDEWKVTIPEEVVVPPLGRVELKLELDLTEALQPALRTVEIQGDFGTAGRPLLSLRLLPQGKSKSKAGQPNPQLKNPSFDVPLAQSDWFTHVSEFDYSLTWDETVGRAQPGSGKVVITKKNVTDPRAMCYIEQLLADRPEAHGALPEVGETWTFGVWVKADKQWKKDAFEVQAITMQEGWKWSEQHSIIPTVRPALNTEWQHVTVDFVRRHESIVLIYLKLNFGDLGTVWVDDCTLTRKGEAAPQPAHAGDADKPANAAERKAKTAHVAAVERAAPEQAPATPPAAPRTEHTPPRTVQLPELRVSENRRFLVQADGRPFFYLGDTAWELFHRLNREEADL